MDHVSSNATSDLWFSDSLLNKYFENNWSVLVQRNSCCSGCRFCCGFPSLSDQQVIIKSWNISNNKCLVNTSAGWKVNWLTKIFSWNVTNELHFFTKPPLRSTHFFHLCSSAWIPLVKIADLMSSYKKMFQPMNFSAHYRSISLIAKFIF